MLKIFNQFECRPDPLEKFDAVVTSCSASCIFADVKYRQGLMQSSVKPAFKAKAVGQEVTVQLSAGDLVDPLKALEMGRKGTLLSSTPMVTARHRRAEA